MMYENSFLIKLDSSIRLSDFSTASRNAVRLEMEWNGHLMKSRVINISERPLKIREVVLFSGELPLSPDTEFYGEGFQMLCQYAGTLAAPHLIGAYGTDWDFFRLPKTPFNEKLWTTYNLLMLSPAASENILMAFTSCHRFSGEFRFKDSYIEIVMDTEDLLLEPGKAWALEEFMFICGNDKNYLYERLAFCMNKNHPPLHYDEIPSGWCSYYCLRPINAEGLYNNATALAERIPELKRIQIDGGYEAKNGDWLIPSATMGADIKTISEGIRQRGAEAAGYISPFIVADDSTLIKEHPDWLVTDEHGKPFNEIGQKRSWYMLDGSNPGAQNYLRTLARVMHDQWGWRYFKLDFLAYGALPGGCRYDKTVTRVEAFRMGLKAIVDAVGHDSFILGCNAPFWPILGLVHGNRVTNDIYRDWKHVSNNAGELFRRNWQNNTLWINDPDCIVVEKQDLYSWKNGERILKKSLLTDNEFEFHKAFIVASGGMVLSGDLITSMSEKNISVLKKLIPPTGVAARFDDHTYTVGRVKLEDREILCIFNWDEEPRDMDISLDGSYEIFDFWTNENLGIHNKTFTLLTIDPHCGRVLVCKPL